MSLRTGDDKRCYIEIAVNGQAIRFLLDTGSTANVVPVSLINKIGFNRNDLKPPRSTLKMFDSSKLHVIGMLTVRLAHRRNEYDAEFYVTETAPPVLGIEACRHLKLINIDVENVCEVRESPAAKRPVPLPRLRRPTPTTPATTGQLNEAGIIERYSDLFEGKLGTLEGDVHLDVDPTVNPVQLPLRRLPIAVRDRVHAELQKLVDNDVIAPVSTPTKWVSALLITTKQDGSLRVCIDPKPLNRALQRSTYYMPTIDDVLPKLINVKVFSTTDAKSAFWHLKLDEESSYLTTFETPFGRFRWMRA